MIVPLIMGIWLGVRAHKAGKNWIGWALVGAVLSFIVSTIVRIVGNAMFGPIPLDSVAPFLIISSIFAIVVTVVTGRLITSGFRKQSDDLTRNPQRAKRWESQRIRRMIRRSGSLTPREPMNITIRIVIWQHRTIRFSHAFNFWQRLTKIAYCATSAFGNEPVTIFAQKEDGFVYAGS